MTSEYCKNHPGIKTLPHRNVCYECQKVKNLESWQKWNVKRIAQGKKLKPKVEQKPIVLTDERLAQIAKEKFKDLYYLKNPISRYIMGIE